MAFLRIFLKKLIHRFKAAREEHKIMLSQDRARTLELRNPKIVAEVYFMGNLLGTFNQFLESKYQYISDKSRMENRHLVVCHVDGWTPSPLNVEDRLIKWLSQFDSKEEFKGYVIRIADFNTDTTLYFMERPHLVQTIFKTATEPRVDFECEHIYFRMKYEYE